MGAVHPWEPLAQIGAVVVGGGEHGLGVTRLEQSDFDAGCYGAPEHMGIDRHRFDAAHEVPEGFCGLRDLEIAGNSCVSGCTYSVSPACSKSNAVSGSSAYWNKFKSSAPMVPYFTSASKLIISFQYFEP